MIIPQESGNVCIYFDVNWARQGYAEVKYHSILHEDASGIIKKITENELIEIVDSNVLDQMKGKAIEHFFSHTSGAV